MPIVTGLTITSSASPEPLGVWGTPSDPPICTESLISGGGGGGGGIPTQYCFLHPHPNPNDGFIVFNFSLSYASRVDMWVVRARLVGERVDEVGVNGGAVVMASRTLPVVELFHNDSLYAGYYQHNWDCRNRNGQPVPAGFYRVYFKVGSFLTWHDIFIYRSLNDLPPGLRRAG